MQNITFFDACCSYVFDKLYKNFPLCVDFKPEEDIEIIIEEIVKYPERVIELDDEKKKKIFSTTILWLERNGFVRVHSTEPSNKNPIIPLVYRNIFCVELTIKGLNLLTSPIPKSLNKRKKLGDEIVEKVKQGAFLEAGREIIEAMFEFSIKRMTNE